MPSIICEQNEHPPISDVVFIVEDTADMAPTIEEFTSSYIVPTLDHFNGGKKTASSLSISGLSLSNLGSHETVEKTWSSVECSTTFSLVKFRSSDSRPRLLTTLAGPFTSAREFLSYLEETQFRGKQTKYF